MLVQFVKFWNFGNNVAPPVGLIVLDKVAIGEVASWGNVPSAILLTVDATKSETVSN